MGAGCSSRSKVDQLPPKVYQEAYDLSDLGQRDSFGPYLKLKATNPPAANGASITLSVLCVANTAAQQRILGSERLPRLGYRESTVLMNVSMSFASVSRKAAGVGDQRLKATVLSKWRDYTFWWACWLCGTAARRAPTA
jgi:hypothetical protein